MRALLSSWTGKALVGIVLLTVAGLLVTVRFDDAAAWWQAILSAAGIFATSVLWAHDREVQRADAEAMREAYTTMLIGHVTGMWAQAKKMARFDPPPLSMSAADDERTLDLLIELRRYWLGLEPFRPYDKTGDFAAAFSVVNVEFACRELLELISKPRSHPETGELSRDLAKVRKLGQELATACEECLATLGARVRAERG